MWIYSLKQIKLIIVNQILEFYSQSFYVKSNFRKS